MRRGSSTKCYSNFKVNLTDALTLCRTRSAKTHGAASALSLSVFMRASKFICSATLMIYLCDMPLPLPPDRPSLSHKVKYTTRPFYERLARNANGAVKKQTQTQSKNRNVAKQKQLWVQCEISKYISIHSTFWFLLHCINMKLIFGTCWKIIKAPKANVIKIMLPATNCPDSCATQHNQARPAQTRPD